MAHPGVFRRRNAIDCGKLPLREAIEAHQGDVVHMPAGTEHQTMNRGPGALKLLFCAPPGSIVT